MLSHPVLILKTVPQDIFIGLGTFYRIMGKLISKTPRCESQEGIEGTTIYNNSRVLVFQQIDCALRYVRIAFVSLVFNEIFVVVVENYLPQSNYFSILSSFC